MCIVYYNHRDYSISRRSLLSQVEARCASEVFLRENAQALVSSSAQSTNQRQPVDISIDIEVSGGVQSPPLSPRAATATLTSYAPLEESVFKDAEAFSEGVGAGEQLSSSPKTSPRSQRRHSKKPAITQIFQLEVN